MSRLSRAKKYKKDGRQGVTVKRRGGRVGGEGDRVGLWGYGDGVPSGRKVGSVDSITCLVHRLGVARPAEQAVLVPGPALSDPADKLSGAGPMARSCPACANPQALRLIGVVRASQSPFPLPMMFACRARSRVRRAPL